MDTIDLLIERHLDSKISDKESKFLFKSLNANKLLVKEFFLRKEINELVLEDEISSLRSQLIQVHLSILHVDKFSSNSNIRKHQIKKLFYAAAAISGIAFGSWFALSESSQYRNHEKLFRDNFKSYPPTMVIRGSVDQEYQKKLFDAIQYYQRGNYYKANMHFEAMLQNNPNSAMLKFYLGISYLQLDEYSKAINLFEEVINSRTIYSDQAIWYKGLAQLAENNIDEAIKTLSQLQKSHGALREKANELREKLEDFQSDNSK